MRSCLMMLVLALPLAGLAETAVYRSVDAEGRVSFSDQPPADAKQVETLPLPSVPSEETLAAARERTRQELAAGREVTDRMAEERRHRERLQVERAQRQPAEPLPLAPAASPEPSLIVWPYGRSHGFDRYRPHPPYRPGPPHHIPPQTPPQTPLKPGFSVEWHRH